MRAAVAERFGGLIALGEAIAESLGLEHDTSWTDRFRIISQARLRNLLAELDEILHAYVDGVDSVRYDDSPLSIGAGEFQLGAWAELTEVAASTESAALSGLTDLGDRIASGIGETARRAFSWRSFADEDDDETAASSEDDAP